MDPEFAPEYTPQERRRRVALAILFCMGLFAFSEGWMLPRWHQLADTAPCRSVFGVPGLAMVFYGLFVGLPWGLAALVLLLTGRTSVRALRSRRFPPPGLKVYRRTRIIRGWRAVLSACVPLAVAAWLVWLGISGMGSTRDLLAQFHKTYPHGRPCASDPPPRPA